MGLAVNLLGLAFFRDHYTGGGGGCAHAHGDDDASCSSGGGDGGGGGDDNMRGVFLHVLADTMGSVGAVVSWVLLRYFHCSWADPLCSLLLSLLILATGVPLLRRAARPLLLAAPPALRGPRRAPCLAAAAAVPCVVAIADARFWQHTAGGGGAPHAAGRTQGVHALLSVVAAEGANLPAVARGVEAVLGQWGVSHATVQVFTAEPLPAALAPCGPAAPWHIREVGAEPCACPECLSCAV